MIVNTLSVVFSFPVARRFEESLVVGGCSFKGFEAIAGDCGNGLGRDDDANDDRVSDSWHDGKT